MAILDPDFKRHYSFPLKLYYETIFNLQLDTEIQKNNTQRLTCCSEQISMTVWTSCCPRQEGNRSHGIEERKAEEGEEMRGWRKMKANKNYNFTRAQSFILPCASRLTLGKGTSYLA
jgi:hypothetical protein